MPIENIQEIRNTQFPAINPVEEIMKIFIPDIIDGVPNRNGLIWVINGSGGSGKTSMMLNFFKHNELYRGKFDNVYYICPGSSFDSVKDHPFADHEKVYHELTAELLYALYDELDAKKESYVANMKKWKQQQLERKKKTKKKPRIIEDEEFVQGEEEEMLEEPELEYHCIIIDDMADALKEKSIVKALNKILPKSRHLQVAIIFTLQSYKYFPKIARKQITNITIFKPKNSEEWNDIAKELLLMNQEDGLVIYDRIFSEPYSHLDIDTVDNKLYKNFNLLDITYSNNLKIKNSISNQSNEPSKDSEAISK